MHADRRAVDARNEVATTNNTSAGHSDADNITTVDPALVEGDHLSAADSHPGWTNDGVRPPASNSHPGSLMRAAEGPAKPLSEPLRLTSGGQLVSPRGGPVSSQKGC